MKVCWALLIVLTLAGCVSRTADDSAPKQAQLRNLGKHEFSVTAANGEAQQAFNRGLNWAYGFGHYAAEQEFRRALEADPECAMAHWGIALVNGPHINFPMVPEPKAKTASAAISRAKSLAARVTPLEQALIEALSVRYADPQPEDRSPLDEAYAKAMERVWQEYPANADVGTLYAEALMDLHPWDLWEDTKPQPWTPEILTVLEKVLVLNPRHPGANHLYIHAMEASGEPEKAELAADRLRTLVPDSSHLVHMPAHIYARVGRWDDAAESNREAMKADARYRSVYPRPGFYGMYMAHNTHFLAWTAMVQGRSEDAIRLARTMVAGIPEDFMAEFPAVADGFTVFVPKVLMRFGRWEEILQEPAPPEGLPLAKALWHYTRTAALTSLDRIEEARAEQKQFRAAAAAVPDDAFFGNNSSKDLLAIAELVLEGEIDARTGNLESSVNKLAEATLLEDKLRYDEPPDWIQPVRHTLGAVLLRAGEPAEAERIYREDLAKFPGNGWSLMGLRDALERQGKVGEARSADQTFKRAWAKADVKPTATCYCQAGL